MTEITSTQFYEKFDLNIDGNIYVEDIDYISDYNPSNDKLNLTETQIDSNFTPYLLFCLKTKIESYIDSVDDRILKHALVRLSLDPDTTKSKRFVKLYFDFMDDEEKIEIDSKMKSGIEKFIDDNTFKNDTHCVIYPFTKSSIKRGDRVVPASFINSILNYIDLRKYKSYIGKYGLYAEINEVEGYDGFVYDITNNPLPFAENVSKLLSDINTLIYKFYIRGCLIFPNFEGNISDYNVDVNSINDKWHFNKLTISDLYNIYYSENVGIIESDDLYISEVINCHLACPYGGMTEFMKSRLNGDNSILIDVGKNIVDIYNVGRLISNYSMSYEIVGNYIRVDLGDNDVNLAYGLLSDLNAVVENSKGKVISILTDSEYYLSFYQKIGDTMGYFDSLVFKDGDLYAIIFPIKNYENGDEIKKSIILEANNFINLVNDNIPVT